MDISKYHVKKRDRDNISNKGPVQKLAPMMQ